MNKVIILGRLGRDPEIRYTQSGTAVANFSMATSERYKDKSGGQQEETEWHRIVVWGAQAETAAKYLEKGRQALIEGKLKTRDWEDKDGNKRSTTEIHATRVQFVGGRNEGQGGGQGNGGQGGNKGWNQGSQGNGWNTNDIRYEDNDVPF